VMPQSMKMRACVDVLRVVAGAMLGLVLMGLMPLYNQPYGGCPVRGFATMERGCSSWPDFLVGMMIVLVVALIGPNRLRPQLWGLVVVMILAVPGGPLAIKQGMHLNLLRPDEMMYYWSGAGLALFLGGLLGSGMFALCLRRWRASRANVA
jgi:hypothetical protein